MAEKQNGAVGAVDELPMQKASPVAYIVGGVAVVVLGGLAVFAMSGSDPDAKAEKAAKTEQAANAAQGMTKEEIEAQREHLKRTQTAMIAAAAEEEEEKKAAAQKEAAQKQAQAAPAPKASAPAPKKKPANTKKSIDGLDALGADITSALQ